MQLCMPCCICQLANSVRSMLCALCCRFGGALFITAPYVVIEKCLFENNAASSYGGAIYIWSQALANNTWAVNEEANVTGCTFRNNTSINVNGGAIYYTGSQGGNTEVFNLTNSTFEGNNASSGGAICPWGVANVIINGSAFVGNTAYYGRGGALYTYGNFRFTVYMLHICLSRALFLLSWAAQMNMLPMVLLLCGDSCLTAFPGLGELSQL